MTSTPMNTVYVVDDDPDIRMSMEVSLMIHGFAVQLFESPDDFLKDYCNEPGCLLLDLNLGGNKTGLDLQSELKLRAPDLPIIFVTGHGGALEAEKAMEAGAVAFLQKPFQPQDLIDQLNKVFIENTVTQKTAVDA